MLRLLLAQASVSIIPVLLFLFALELIDTYKLLTLGRVLRSVGVGCGVAVICYGLNTAIYASGIASPGIWARSAMANTSRSSPMIRKSIGPPIAAWSFS